MEYSETDRIRGNYIYSGHQNIIPIQQAEQMQGQPIIILSQPVQLRQIIQFQPNTQYQHSQYQPYNYQQSCARPAQPVGIPPVKQNSELINIQNQNPIINKPVKESKKSKQNNEVSHPEKKSDSDSSEKKYVCRYCNKRMNTVEKRCFNVCTCLFYLFYVLFFPIILIISLFCKNSFFDNNCNCKCYDIDYKCPYCGGIVDSYKSCPLRDCCNDCFCCCCTYCGGIVDSNKSCPLRDCCNCFNDCCCCCCCCSCDC